MSDGRKPLRLTPKKRHEEGGDVGDVNLVLGSLVPDRK